MASEWKIQVMGLLTQPGSTAMNKNELARALEVPPEERAALREALRELTEEGTLVEGRARRYSPREASGNLMTGTLKLRPGGGGSAILWIEAADSANAAVLQAMGASESARVTIPGQYTDTALHGDRVTVKVTAGPAPTEWRHVKGKRVPREARQAPGEMSLEGRVVQVLERKNDSIPGTLFVSEKHAWVVPDDTMLPHIDILTGSATIARPGDKVIATIEEWRARGQRPRGRIVQRLGRPGEKGVDVMGVICKYNLAREFPADVLKEADDIPDEIPASEIAVREDWREAHIITIDPFDAKDFDDAIGVIELPGGGWELAVHIADVSHYVRPGSALDREAWKRGNSTYLVDRVIPMLPERLSNGLCSLRPNEDKLTRFAILTFDSLGRRTGARFGTGIICSRRRYTYEAAMACLKETNPGDPDAQLLHRAWGLASKLRERRFGNGALDLEFPEVKIILDDQGKPVRFARVMYDESHQLVEEFMLAANEAVAEALLRSGRPAIYRVHEDPDPEKLADLRELLAAEGIPAGDLTVRRELQRVIAAFSGREEEPVLKLALLKSLKRAAYHPDALGHFGLAFRNYTHFTSPIRRYADLIVHRLLWNLKFAPGSKQTMKAPDYARMKETAEHISLTERNSSDAETESRRMKELEFFENLAQQENPPPVHCLVTRVLGFGLFVETVDTQTRGAIRFSDLGCPDAFFDGATSRIVSRSGGLSFKAGDVLECIPVGIERDRGSVAFRFTGGLTSGKAPAKGGGKSARNGGGRPGNGGKDKGARAKAHPPGPKPGNRSDRRRAEGKSEPKGRADSRSGSRPDSRPKSEAPAPEKRGRRARRRQG